MTEPSDMITETTSTPFPTWMAKEYYRVPELGAVTVPASGRYEYVIRGKVPTFSDYIVENQTRLMADSQLRFNLSSANTIFSSDIVLGKWTRSYFYDQGDSKGSHESIVQYHGHHGEISRSWVDHFKSPNVAKYESGLRDVVCQVRRYSSYKQGWDSHNAKPIEWKTISRSIILFSSIVGQLGSTGRDLGLPCVAPLVDGGIEFELETLFKELIFSIPDQPEAPIQYLLVDKVSQHEEEGDISERELVDLVMRRFLYY